MSNFITVTVTAKIGSPIVKVWECWTEPAHIIHWNNASADWHTPHAENDLRTGGRFLSRMEAKDGSMGFDFSGIYDEVILHQKIAYTMEDDRKVTVTFNADGNNTDIIETFEAEQVNPVELQQQGWQSILNNFKNYAESS